MISVIVPAYKEAETIEGTIRKLLKILRDHKISFEIIVIVDEVPNDKTADIVGSLTKEYKEIRSLIRKGKKGVGKALRDGIKMSHGNVIIPIMADSSENPMDVIRLSQKVEDGYEIAVGNRFIRKSALMKYPLSKYIANRGYYCLVKVFFSFPSNDVTNAFKAYNAEILKNLTLESDGFEIFAEIPLKAYLSGYTKVVNVPVSYYDRKEGAPKLILMTEGRKYLRMLGKLVRYRLTHDK